MIAVFENREKPTKPNVMAWRVPQFEVARGGEIILLPPTKTTKVFETTIEDIAKRTELGFPSSIK